ncbi:MAG: UPF0182 family protein [Actinomycetota bacterium]|nr:UPF0182 family protein [Actinomycetota bacterium]
MSTVRLSGRPRRWPLAAIAVLIALAVLFTLMSQFYVDLLWYREVGFTSVFWTVIRTKALLGLVFGLLFFALLLANLLIVRWISPSTRVLMPDQEVVERIRVGVEPYLRWLLPVGSAVIALFVGIGVSGQWQTYLLWRHSSGVVFGHPEALFGRDPAFYIFTLPWLRFLQGWLFSSLVGVTFLSGIAHFLWGGIRPQAPALADKVTPPVRAHLSVLLGLIMLAKAWGYYLGRFDLLTSKRGVVEGASYTDIHAQMPALSFLAIVAAICAVLFLINIRVRLWSLPVIAVALLGIVSVILGTAVPAFVQHFSVKPQEQQRELPYIQRNIEGTRAAFGLDTIHSSQLAAGSSVTPSDIQANDATVSNVRLWRPTILAQNFQSLQRIRQYYDFNDVDVDRYQIGNQRRVLMVAGREISQDGVPNGTWQNSHLVFTHGFGAVASQANATSAEGAPVFTLKDVPPTGEPLPAQPRIYYGELHDVPFVITGTKTQELDYEGAPSPQNYTGSGGIPMGNLLQRALFAWRFRDINLLISGQITSQSRIMIYRDIYSRVPKPVPFLSFDYDPYLAITSTGMQWIWNAYTTSNQYPYSQSVQLADATQGDMGGAVNYMRNSVKVVVDAYTGKMTYYADLTDPIIQAWSAAFPGLLTPIDQAPADLQAHFRYPEDLFQVQAFQYGRYHVTDPLVFYQNQDVWQVPDDPTTGQTSVQTAAGEATKLRPYYLLMKTPGDATERFQLVLPFVPQGRQNMVAWMAANSDPGPDYGRMVAFVFENRNVEGPAQIFSRINQNPTFSSARTLLGQGGSQVLFGDFLVIPMGNSFLYVEPVYVRSAQTTAVPELKRVIVVNGDVVGLADTFSDALSASLQGQAGGQKPGSTGGSVDQQVTALLNQALQHFAAADAALANQDLARYQSEIKLGQGLVKQANALAASAAARGSGSGASVSPSLSPSLSPSPSP